jgi:hypothetical protein
MEWLCFALLIVVFALLLACHSHGDVVLRDTVTVTRFDWTGTNAQFSADLTNWHDYDRTVYSPPIAVSGSNAARGFLRAPGATNWTETLTNTRAGLTVIGSAFYERWRATNEPPPIP